jgi:hypothetical protein
MSNTVGSSALYTVAVSEPSKASGVPEDAKELKHHCQDGKGFKNPWDSWKEFNYGAVVVLLWYTTLDLMNKFFPAHCYVGGE